MSDVITAAERALIDAAVAAGKVQIIPRGVSGEVVGRVSESAGSGASAGARVKRSAAAKARQQLIAKLWHEGKTVKEIAKAVERSIAMVNIDLQGLRALGLVGRRR